MVALASKAKAWLAARLLAQGHQVFSSRTRRSAEQFLNGHCPDAIVLGHSLEQEDREVLVAKARLIRPDAGILFLHASGADLPVVPHAAIDSRKAQYRFYSPYRNFSMIPDRRSLPQNKPLVRNCHASTTEHKADSDCHDLGPDSQVALECFRHREISAIQEKSARYGDH